MTVTNLETGPPEEKPAVFIHAQIHAMEFTGTTAALTLLDRLLHGYGERRARDARARHAHVLRRPAREPGRRRRGARRRALPALERAPVPARRAAGRAPPRGRRRRRACPDDAAARPERLLESRTRTTRGCSSPAGRTTSTGEFYRVFPEGTIQNWDGVTVTIAPAFEGLDLNRNWPADWAPEGDQLGAGPYPASEPEVRALVEAIVGRTNITSYVGYHTFSGVHLRPYSGAHGRGLPDARPARVQAHGRGGDAPHRLPVDLDLPRLQVRPEDGHPGRRRRLGLRLPRRLRVGDGVLEPAARGRPRPTTTSSTGSASTRPRTTSRC